MKPASRGETKAAVLKRLPEITQWRAEGIAQREIARRLGIADSSLRHALKDLGLIPQPSTEADPPRRPRLSPLSMKVYLLQPRSGQGDSRRGPELVAHPAGDGPIVGVCRP